MSAERPDGERVLEALGGLARRGAPGDAPPSEPDRGLSRALAGFREARAAPRRPRLWLLAAALAGLVALALGIAWPRAPLRFTVEGASAAAGGYVHARGEGPAATARFTDGSVVTFAAGADGRITDVDAHGARVVLQSGEATFHVAHLPGARWSVEAGPFVIAVVGTAFEVSWSVDTQELDVRLLEGAVTVRGPLIPRGVDLRAGQHLTFAALAPRVDAPAASTAVVVVEAPPRASVAPAAVAAPPPSSAAPSWARRVAAGDFRGVVADAEARGLDASLRQASLPDLVALADASRYAGRSDLAQRALLAERARFAASPEARAAAFLLGRIADDGGGPASAAIGWYDRYLSEAPGGLFAAEALGRKLAALQRSADPAARTTAAEYLRLYPEGPHAARARELLAAP